MHTKEEAITLGNIGGGAAVELFDLELRKVLKDVLDPNTDAKTIRSISLRVTLKPDEDREMGVIGVSVASKLAGSKEFLTKAFFGIENGRPEARELETGQGNLFNQDGNVVPITTNTGGQS